MTEDLHQHEVERLHAAWMSGGPARALIEELIRLKRMDEAGSLARLTPVTNARPLRNCWKGRGHRLLVGSMR